MSSDVLDAGAEALSRACRIDSVCDRFEAAWKTGQRPRIEDYLGEMAESERSLLVRELILLEVHYRRLAGETCLVREYDGRFQDLDSVWLAGAIPASHHTSSTPTVPVAPDPAAHALSTPSPSETTFSLTAGSPDSLGDYEIREVIGESGMGVVYKAWQRSLNRTVALKTIKHGRHLSPVELQRFRAEAEMAADARLNGWALAAERGERSGAAAEHRDEQARRRLLEPLHVPAHLVDKRRHRDLEPELRL